MLKKELVIKRVAKDRLTGEIIWVDVSCGLLTKKINLDELRHLKSKGYVLANAVLDYRGILRAKTGKLDYQYVYTK